MSLDDAKKFDPSRAAEYDRQARVALAGYEAMHELGAGYWLRLWAKAASGPCRRSASAPARRSSPTDPLK